MRKNQNSLKKGFSKTVTTKMETLIYFPSDSVIRILNCQMSTTSFNQIRIISAETQGDYSSMILVLNENNNPLYYKLL